MTLTQVRSFGRIWQHRLKISEWDITYRWMTNAESKSKEHSEHDGFCYWNEHHKQAEIVLSRQSADIRHTVVHECEHIRLQGHAPFPGVSIPFEVALNAMAEAYLKLYDEAYPEINQAAQEAA